MLMSLPKFVDDEEAREFAQRTDKRGCLVDDLQAFAGVSADGAAGERRQFGLKRSNLQLHMCRRRGRVRHTQASHNCTPCTCTRTAQSASVPLATLMRCGADFACASLNKEHYVVFVSGSTAAASHALCRSQATLALLRRVMCRD
jgi:hypothetical protein